MALCLLTWAARTPILITSFLFLSLLTTALPLSNAGKSLLVFIHCNLRGQPSSQGYSSIAEQNKWESTFRCEILIGNSYRECFTRCGHFESRKPHLKDPIHPSETTFWGEARVVIRVGWCCCCSEARMLGGSEWGVWEAVQPGVKPSAMPPLSHASSSQPWILDRVSLHHLLHPLYTCHPSNYGAYVILTQRLRTTQATHFRDTFKTLVVYMPWFTDGATHDLKINWYGAKWRHKPVCLKCMFQGGPDIVPGKSMLPWFVLHTQVYMC